jgi:hypothetical protein
VVPPEAVKVALAPLHIVNDGDAVIVGVGVVLTVTVRVSVAVHPLVVPVRVYPVLVVGLTAMLVVVAPPGFQAYVVAPDPLKVVALPLQMVNEGEAVIVTVGVVVTVTVTVPAELLHPVTVLTTE